MRRVYTKLLSTQRRMKRPCRGQQAVKWMNGSASRGVAAVLGWSRRSDRLLQQFRLIAPAPKVRSRRNRTDEDVGR